MHIDKIQDPTSFMGRTQEYTAYYDYKDNEIESVDENRFNRITNLGITEDMRGMVSKDSEFDQRDFLPYTYPP